MQTLIKFVPFLVASVVFFGCAISPASVAQTTEDPAFLSASADSDKQPRPWGEIKPILDEANTALDAGDPEMALWLYQQLAHDYQSKDGRFEVGVLTNASIACLELGDREGFLDYANRLDDLSRNLYQLPHNAQVVLALKDFFLNDFPDRERKIKAGLSAAVKSSFNLHPQE